jgi:glycosyltransferase involved in cell wall biosynthesis
LIRLYGTDPKKISVVHLGCDVVSLASETKKGNSGRPYLLYVGLRSGYKNFNRFVQAYAASAQLRDSFDIVAFGGGNLTTTEQDFLQGLQLRTGEVRQIDGDDAMLAQYYCNASALVYPSSYEGFGLPPLEAMAYRCPVVSSNASVMPEVIGDAAEFFDPLNIDSIACAIQNVVLSPTRVKDLVAKGLERVTQFNWRRCAEEHLAVYEKLAGISKFR